MDSAAADHFALFGLPRAVALDADELQRRYHRLQAQAHPDRHAGAPDHQRRLALQMASRINDAYAVLKGDLSRAAYLLLLYGADVYSDSDTAVDADFIEQQLEWREALQEAQDAAAQAALRQEIKQARDGVAAAAGAALTALIAQGGGDTGAAYDLVRRWTYLEKLLAPANFPALADG